MDFGKNLENNSSVVTDNQDVEVLRQYKYLEIVIDDKAYL